MTNSVENLIIEHLRAVRADIAAQTQAIGDLTLRISSLEEHVAGLRRDVSLLHSDIAITHKRIDGVDACVGRIEKRLELA